MPTLQDQNNKLDPDQQEYKKNFSFGEHTKGGDGASAESGGSNKYAPMPTNFQRDKRSTREREIAPAFHDIGPSPAGGLGDDKGGGNPVTKAVKKKIAKWVIGSSITAVFGFGAGIPAVMTQVGDNIKTIGTDWANKNNKSFMSKYAAKFFTKKFFNKAKAGADGSKVKDRFSAGISDEEIKKMEKAGLKPEVGDEGGNKYLKSMEGLDADGNKVKVTADNFDTHYGSSTNFRGAMDNIAKPASMLMRGANQLKYVFDKFKIKRNLAIEGANDRERNRSFRETIYGGGENDTHRANAPPSEGEGQTDPNDANRINNVDESINAAAQEERSRMQASNFDTGPSIVPDTTNLDIEPSRGADVANASLKGGVKSAFQGIFSAIDKACSGYQLIRAVIFGAKIYKVIGLITYVGTFMVIFDKMRAGDGGLAELGYLMGILLRPSSQPDSLGKTFFQSTGWNLIFQGKVADHRGLARFSVGTPYIKYLQRAKKVFENVGANKTTCKQVQSWYGQIILIVSGLSTDIFTAGAGAVIGIAAGATVGVIVSLLMEYVTPLLIQYAAGTVAPDALDKEGGFAAGNAIGAALGAFGSVTGKANGTRPLKKKQAATVDMESNKEIAFEKSVENRGKNPFSLDSPDSIPTKLAFAVAPYMSSFQAQGSVQSLAAVFASPFTMFGSSLGTIFSGSVGAQADTSNRQGDFCPDEDYSAMDLAVDANCNTIPGEEDSTINDPTYDPENVLHYMLPKSSDNPDGHDEIDPDSGEPKSDDYKKYMASCVDSVVPLSPDGGGSDVGEDVDTRWCADTAKKFTMYRFFIAQTALDKAHKASVNGTLGLDEGATANNTAGSMTAEQCKALTDKGAQVTCNGALFEPYYYKWGGGHGSLDEIKKFINDAINGQNKGAAILDCSGFVRTVYYMTYGVDMGGLSSEAMAHSKYFSPISDTDAKAGDLLWHQGHVALVVSNDPGSSKWTIIEASTDGKPIAQSTAKYSEFEAFRYTGAQ